MQSSVIKYNKFNSFKISHDELKFTKNKQMIISKLWYNELNNIPKNIHIQTSFLKINQLYDDNIVLILTDETSKLFDDVDASSISFIKTNNILNKYNLVKPSYKALVHENTHLDKKVNCVRLKILNNTSFFIENKHEKKNLNDIKHLLNNNVDIKIIFELDSLVIDPSKNIIFTNVILRQVLIHKIIPIKVELSEYSFIESDKENDVDNVINENELVLNTQTEYPPQINQNDDDDVEDSSVYSEESEEESEEDLPKQSIKINMKQSNEHSDSDSLNSGVLDDDVPENSDESDSENSVDVDNFLKTISEIKTK